ncbi:hypothetical protein DFJ74DRAFT_5151 [Hyaloraphidium curvatum]|nr:hypothetical protein DFJ74DRAFT_5151 [Hyaloraphidium curvatum]
MQATGAGGAPFMGTAGLSGSAELSFGLGGPGSGQMALFDEPLGAAPNSAGTNGATSPGNTLPPRGSEKLHPPRARKARVSGGASPYPAERDRRLLGTHAGAAVEDGMAQHHQTQLSRQSHVSQLPTAPGAKTPDAVPAQEGNRVLALFADLPQLPSQAVYNELIGLYFEKLPPTLAIIHRDQFLGSLAITPSTPGTEQQPANRGGRPPASLVFSMIALSSRYHPAFKDSPELCRTMWYERAKRLLLPRLADRGTADIATLKTVLHLCVFALGLSMWQAAYFWLGTAVSMSRMLGLYVENSANAVGDSEDGLLKGAEQFPERWMLDADGTSGDVLASSGDQDPVGKEEKRRCYWAIRNLDVHFAFALKRPAMFSSREHFFTLHIPIPDATFYGIFGISPTALSKDLPLLATTAVTMEMLFRPVAGNPLLLSESTLGPSSYIAALMDVLASVVEFRQHCHRLGFLAFRPTSENQAFYVNNEAERIELKMRTWWQRLPETVRAVLAETDAGGDPDMLSSGVPGALGFSGSRLPVDPIVPSSGWWWGGEAEEYDFICAGMAFFVIGATLFAPEYNLTATAMRLACKDNVVLHPAADGSVHADTFSRAQTEIRQVDAALSAWQSSSWFARSVDYASRGSRLLRVIEQMSGNETRRDTPLFAFCAYQLGLLNLIAARQLTVDPGLSASMFTSSGSDAGLLGGVAPGQFSAALLTVFRNNLLDLAGVSARLLAQPTIFSGHYAAFPADSPGSPVSRDQVLNPNGHLLNRLLGAIGGTGAIPVQVAGVHGLSRASVSALATPIGNPVSGQVTTALMTNGQLVLGPGSGGILGSGASGSWTGGAFG